MEKIVGPTEITIPEHKYLSCRNCKCYRNEMIKTGVDPIYKKYCVPEGIGNFTAFFAKEIISDITPDWCPILNTNKN